MPKLLTLCVAVTLSVSLQAQPAEHAKGDIVRLAPQADGDPLPDSRILAVPGDRIQVRNSGVMVNGQPVRDLSEQMLAQLTAEPWDQVIPEGHYVVVGERQVTPGRTVRYNGLIPSSKILGKASK